ncbi:MAG: hypothetical protein HYX76_03295 [Acidobacteria bacterium]|nr:hypothetical protein [Acidobacteriota bacterium]
MSPRPPLAVVAAGAALFVLVAILNCGGYRYGVGDQAFYVPAIEQQLNPSLFPRDRALIHAQDRLMLSDEALAATASVIGSPLPALFFSAHIVTLLLLFGSAAWFARACDLSWLGIAAFECALTLRHRIEKTGANTLEGYFHPRVLAFAIGVAALAAAVRGRVWVALLATAVAFLVHPTTALFFGAWIAVAAFVGNRSARLSLILTAPVVIAGGIWGMAGPLREQLTVMDETWLAAIAAKDYVFPTEWRWSVWALNLSYVVVILAIHRSRTKLGLTRAGERGLVVGTLALVGLFFASLPFVQGRIALAVQLQTSRVFWLLDFLAVFYLAWLLIDAPAPWRPRRAAVAVAGALAAIAIARGAYVTFVEHPGRSVIAVSLPQDEWMDVMMRARETPLDSHLLVEPGHAWRYGISARIGAERDVYLEEVKDSAIAIYSRPVASRVVQRTRELADFAALTPDRARELAEREDLDYLVTEARLALPEVYHNSRFWMYRLK